MAQRHKLATLLTILTVSAYAPAAPLQDCHAELAAAVSQKLSAFSGLKAAMVRFAADPLVPNRLKALVQKALEGDDVEIKRLTQELREQFGLSPEHNALAGKEITKFRLVPRAGMPSLNQQVSDQIGQRTVKSNYLVMVQDRVLGRDHNDLLTLLHELAHIRLGKFVEKNIAAMAARTPYGFITRGADGVFEIDELYWAYLDERYAVESEFLALRETYGRYYTDFPASWNIDMLDMPEEQIRARLSDYVCFSYEIRDPKICSLRNRKLSDILLFGER